MSGKHPWTDEGYGMTWQGSSLVLYVAPCKQNIVLLMHDAGLSEHICS